MFARWIHVKRWFLWLGVAALALGLFVLAYRGPGRAVIRGNVGDVAATMLVYAVLAAITPRAAWLRALAAFGIASAIELGQAYWTVTSTAGALTLGDTCDPWDIVAYAVGVGIALVWERIVMARCAACASPTA